MALYTNELSAQVTQSIVSSPHVIDYQAQLLEDGRPIDGKYNVTITIYSDPDGKVALWSDQFMTDVRGGVFNIALGSNHPLPSSKELDKAIWVGVKLDGNAELRPLTQLGSVPFALNVADGAITSEKIGTDYVSSIRVNGEKVSSKAASINFTGGKGLKVNFDKETQSITIDAPSLAQSPDKRKNSDKGALAIDRIALWDPTTSTASGGPVGTVTTVLHGNGGGAPSYTQIFNNDIANSTINLTTKVTGVLPLANGGTGSSTDVIWRLTGNNGTTAGTNFVGTTDNVALEIRVNNNGFASEGRKRVMRFEPNATSANIIGGYNANSVGVGVVGATIAGGGYQSNTNSVSGNFGSIGGGNANTAGSYGVIAGGKGNIATATNSVIGGGNSNTISSVNNADESVIGGGAFNEVRATRSAILGGAANTVSSTYGAIVGGLSNEVTGEQAMAMGEDLIAQGYGQTALGHHNRAQGNSTLASHLPDDRLFIIGNGTTATRSNSFEVSQNGHSIVYHTLGGGANAPVTGGTYTDNVIYAWGDVTAGATPTINSSFGVANVVRNGIGSYTVQLSIVDPVTAAPVLLNAGAATANLIVQGSGCFIIYVSPIVNSAFTVTIKDVSSCSPADQRFTFHVTGR